MHGMIEKLHFLAPTFPAGVAEARRRPAQRCAARPRPQHMPSLAHLSEGGFPPAPRFIAGITSQPPRRNRFSGLIRIGANGDKPSGRSVSRRHRLFRDESRGRWETATARGPTPSRYATRGTHAGQVVLRESEPVDALGRWTTSASAIGCRLPRAPPPYGRSRDWLRLASPSAGPRTGA